MTMHKDPPATAHKANHGASQDDRRLPAIVSTIGRPTWNGTCRAESDDPKLGPVEKRGNRVGAIDDPVWTAPEVAERELRSTSRHSVIVASLVVLLVTVVALPAGLSLMSRNDYGTFAFWGLPQRIDYCGRRYYPGGSEAGSPSQFTHKPAVPGRWSLTSHTFSLRPIYAVTLANTHSTVCAMVMYIPLGGQQWEAYSLSGGP